MSDPVTNVEIEDVLSSIRRLVSDGDKARTRDPAPVAAEAKVQPVAPEDTAGSSESVPDKFVLTPAFMVVDNDASPEAADDAPEHAGDHSYDDDEDVGWVEEISAGADDEQTDESHQDNAAADDVADGSEDDAAQDPLPLTDMVWDSVNDARKAGIAAVPDATSADATVAQPERPNRSDLVATIAELEAAVSDDADDYEPDGSEVTNDMMGETIAWPGAVARSFDDVPDAEESSEPEATSTLDVEDAPLAFEHRTPDAEPEALAKDTVTDDDADTGAKQDDYGDDDLDGLLEAGGVSLDEEALRALVSEVVREELTGPLGERITRNVRKLVRREIYRILSSKEFD